MTTIELLQKTKAAWPALSAAPAEEKNRLLLAMADALESHIPAILAANAQDMADAQGHISAVMLDRLRLDESRVRAMADGVRAAAALPDHTGRALAQFTRPNGMTITKVQVPLGLVAIIYESRPNVTSDAAALAVKSGNVCMLRSGKKAYRSCHAIVDALKDGITAAGGAPDIVNIVEDTTHQSANDIMQARGLVDLLIPRGGGADPRLRGERRRSLHRNRHRHLPRLCGCRRRSGQGRAHHHQCQDQPPLRLQRRGGLPGTRRRGG